MRFKLPGVFGSVVFGFRALVSREEDSWKDAQTRQYGERL